MAEAVGQRLFVKHSTKDRGAKKLTLAVPHMLLSLHRLTGRGNPLLRIVRLDSAARGLGGRRKMR